MSKSFCSVKPLEVILNSGYQRQHFPQQHFFGQSGHWAQKIARTII